MNDSLLEALRHGAAQPGEQRLFRSGKLPGLFASRTSANAEAAARGVREALIEIVRTEVKGKTTVEWARVTQQGIDYLLRQEAPTHALQELRELLRANEAGVPAWVAELRGRIDALGRQLLADVDTLNRRLEQVQQRVTAALERLEQAHAPRHAASLPEWGGEAQTYLRQRAHSLPDRPCSLAELFAALRTRGVELGLKDFHAGLRRLYEHGLVRLHAHNGDGAPSEPEYALLEGAEVFHYAAPA